MGQDPTKLLNYLFYVGFTTQPTKRPPETALSDDLPIFRLPIPKQPEIKPAPPPSFPRRRESWLGCGNVQINKQPPNPKQIPTCAGMTLFAAFQTASFAKSGVGRILESDSSPQAKPSPPFQQPFTVPQKAVGFKNPPCKIVKHRLYNPSHTKAV